MNRDEREEIMKVSRGGLDWGFGGGDRHSNHSWS